ncbi:unnamed protein product, partial [Closterium sp. NIES-53]
GSETCPYVIRTGARAGRTCGRFHTECRCFARLDDAWHTEFGDDVERPRWTELLRSGVAIFDLDFDVIISAMYALSFSAKCDCYWCVPPDAGIAAAALGASASSTPPGTAPAEALHTFTLDSGASRCFFRDSTTLTPLPAPVPVRLADPSGGPVVANSSTVLPCPAVPSGSLSGLHLPSFSTNLVSASGQVAAACSCRLLSHQTLLWHHRLGHPSLPRLRGMHSRLLVSGLPRSLPPLPPSPALPCLPCDEGQQRAAPHSSSFPPTTAPLQTLHMDVWGPARVSGQGRERYFLLVVDDYTRYTTVFPLCSKGEVSAVLIPWIRTARLQLRELFGQDLPVLRLHSDRGGECSSDLLWDFFHGEGIRQSFMLPDSPQQNEIAERRIGLVMEVGCTSMIHAAAPHFLWPFAVRYAAHQLNLWPCVSLPETSPTLRWTGKVGDASVFRVWGSRAFVRDKSADKLSARAIPCVLLGFVPDAPGWQFYHPTSRCVLPSQDVMFNESVPFYHPLRGTAPVQVAVVSGASPGAASGGAEPGGAGSEGAGSGGAEPESVEPGGAEWEGAEPGGAESEGAESGGAEPRGAASSGGPAGASPRLSSQQLREWLVQHAYRRTGAPEAGEPGDAGAGVGGARAGVAGVGGPCAGGAGAAGAGAVEPAGGAGGTVRPRPHFVPLLQQVLGVPSSTGLPPPFLCPPPDQSQPPLQPASPLLVPFPYTEKSGGLTEHREPASRPVSPVRTTRRAPRSRPPPVPDTHTMALRPSSVPLRVPLPTPPESSLPEVPDQESDRACTASPTVARLLATAVNDASLISACRPPSVGGECALGTDVLEDRQEDFECLAAAVPRFASLLLAPEGDPDAPKFPTPRSYAEAITGPYSSQWQAAMDAEMASWKSTGTSVDEVPPPKGADYFQTFSPTPKMTTLRVLLHVATRRDYELHSLDFSTAFLQGSLHEEIWLRRPPGFTRSFPAGTQWSLRRPLYGLRQAPRKWHDTLRTTLAALGFVPSTAHPSLFLRTDTSLPPFYVLVYVDDLVFATADTEALTLLKSFSASASSTPRHSSLLSLLATRSQLHLRTSPMSGMGLVLGGRGPVVLTGHADASWVDDSATQRSSQGYTFSLGSGSVSLRSTHSSSVLSSSYEAEIYAGAMAAQELRWLTYLLTDLGEQPRSPLVLYVVNKAMIALCQKHRLEHRTKHIALRYFLARELQQRGQLRLAYVATRANTADVFTKALPPGDHQRFVTVLGLCDSKDGLSLFDLTSGTSTAPTADNESTVRSQWLTHDTAARLAVRNHLPSTERAHFSQYKSARALYDTVVARYSSPTTAALSRLMLPYLFPDLAAFATVADLVAHLRTSDARYRAALPTEFLPTNSPPMYITLYYLVTRLPDSLSSVKDHFLSLCPTELTVELLEERLAAAEKSILAVGASRGDRRTPFFEGRSALHLPLVGDAAPARGREARVVEGAVGAAVEAVEEVEVVVGVVQGVGESVAAVEAVAAVAEGVEAAAAVVDVAEEVVLVAVQLRRVEALVAASASSSSAPVRPRRFSSFVSGTLGVGGLGVRFPDAVELPRWHDLLLQNVPIFDLDFDVILAAMYAFADISEGDCYQRVPPDPGTLAAALGASAAAALGASASAAPGAGMSPLSGTAPTESFHTFTHNSGASRSFFRDSTTLTPLSRPVAVSLADPSGGPVLAHSSMVLPCPAAPSGLLSGLHLPSFSTNMVSGADLQDAWVDQFTPGGQRVTHCTCSRTGRHLATFTRRPGSSLYTLTTAPPPVPASGQLAASSQVFAAASRSSPASAPCSCRPLAHETLLWHHRLGHPSLPRLRGMAYCALVSGLPRSLPPLPPGPAPTYVPCVEGQQRAAPHSSSFPPTEAPLQTLHMDGEVTEVLIDWIHGARRQLCESFGSDLLVLRLHSDRGGEFSSDLLRAFCRLEGIRQMFTLPASLQQNGIAERRIGMVMDVARMSMIHAAAPHFLWPFAVQYAAHHINLQPRVSLPETTPTLRWTGKVGDASAFRFYHPTSRRVLSSQDVTFDESVSYYRLFPYRTASPPPPPLFLAPDPAEPVEVAVASSTARGAESGGAETGGAESGGAETGRAEPRGVL